MLPECKEESFRVRLSQHRLRTLCHTPFGTSKGCLRCICCMVLRLPERGSSCSLGMLCAPKAFSVHASPHAPSQLADRCPGHQQAKCESQTEFAFGSSGSLMKFGQGTRPLVRLDPKSPQPSSKNFARVCDPSATRVVELETPPWLRLFACLVKRAELNLHAHACSIHAQTAHEGGIAWSISSSRPRGLRTLRGEACLQKNCSMDLPLRCPLQAAGHLPSAVLRCFAAP